MIKPSDCVLAGKVNKAHGLDGELSISFFSDDIVESVEVGACLIFEVDGIHTPFFVRTVRPRGAEALLVAFDDVYYKLCCFISQIISIGHWTWEARMCPNMGSVDRMSSINYVRLYLLEKVSNSARGFYYYCCFKSINCIHHISRIRHNSKRSLYNLCQMSSCPSFY